ncbi:hypothetical protein [Planomonospora sphaerica]|uniref:hypothetical protein n=1 Tax=Planomonospora sphaerica TaxID=161355 RepID=UPI00083A8468|nr:hypothetical protein [Planomonospora sphaerica]
MLHRHRFRPDDARACARCSELAAAAPTVPSSQERLHDEVLTSAPGPLRTRLLDALRNGAAITMWVRGPADKLAFYVRLDRITDGAAAVKALLATRDRLGLARVA